MNVMRHTENVLTFEGVKAEQHRRRVLAAVGDYHKHRTKSGGSLHRARLRSSILAKRGEKIWILSLTGKKV